MGRVGLKVLLPSPEHTLAFGREMAAQLSPNTILALSGDLGAGKTTFVQGLALGLGIQEPIQSPTFVLLNIYERLYHFDLYRLKKSSDFTSLGFDEYFHKEGLCAIEWPERIQELLPPTTLHIHFSYHQQERIVEVRS